MYASEERSIPFNGGARDLKTCTCFIAIATRQLLMAFREHVVPSTLENLFRMLEQKKFFAKKIQSRIHIYARIKVFATEFL